MIPYVFDAELPYRVYLLSGAAAATTDVDLTPRARLLLGSPTPPAGWPAPVGAEERAFHWGRSEELLETDFFNVPLTELKNATQTSAVMWAMEQFDIARDAFRRGLDQEAFDHVQRAIEGDDTHDGYGLDYRCHLLLGVLRLGSFSHLVEPLLDLEAAEQAFAAATRYALCDHPLEAARTSLAAGWCAYCQGHMDDALRHTQQALVLNADSAAAQFQAAKIILHRREPDAARPFLAIAIKLNPAYAAQALGDGDFMPFTALVLDLLEQERDRLGRRASEALRSLGALTTSLGLDAAANESPDVAPDDATALIVTLADAAKAAFRDSSVHGYLRAEAAAAAATQAANVYRNRLAHEQQVALEAIQDAREKLTATAALQIGPYRLTGSALRQLDAARTALAEAETIFRQQTARSYLDAHTRAKRVIAALKQTADAYRDSALEQATAECEALEREIEELQRRHTGDGSSAKTFAMVGALVALFPGGILSFISFARNGTISWPDVLLRTCLSVALFGLIGAVLGALLAPMFHTERAPVQPQLEDRRTALKQTIAELRSLAKVT